jgi:hypothetical protein
MLTSLGRKLFLPQAQRFPALPVVGKDALSTCAQKFSE